MRKWLLVSIVVLAFVLRTVSLDKYPSGFTPDEASFGYDAYSVLKTGADQWGHKLPLVLESFGDFKSPLYTYLDIPFVAMFGLNVVSVRLPNAILGALAVLVVYFLSSKLFSQKVGLFVAFFFAISPWHIMLSRGAFEANLTTFFLPLGLYLLLSRKYTLGAVMFGLNLFSYHTAKFVTPAVVLVFIVLYKNQLLEGWKSKKQRLDLGVAVLVLAIFGITMAYTFLIGAGSRVSERSITQGATEAAFVERTNLAGTVGEKIARLIHNKYEVTVKRFLENYSSYFSPQFLFTSGPREATYGMIPARGVLLWFALPFLLLAWKYKGNGRNKKPLLLLGSWILLTPIPAALASGVGFSANRVAAMMPAINILIGLGAYTLYDLTKNKKIILLLCMSVVAILFGLFVEDYFLESPAKTSQAMLYGNLDVVEYLSKNIPEDKSIVVDKSLSEPHIYFAFGSQMDPREYQRESSNWNYKDKGVNWVDQLGEYTLGKFTFKDISKADIKSGNILVGKPSDFNFEVKPIKTIHYPSGEVAIEIVQI